MCKNALTGLRGELLILILLCLRKESRHRAVEMEKKWQWILINLARKEKRVNNEEC